MKQQGEESNLKQAIIEGFHWTVDEATGREILVPSFELDSEKYYCALCKEVHFWSNICIEMLEYSGIFDWLDEGLGQPDVSSQ